MNSVAEKDLINLNACRYTYDICLTMDSEVARVWSCKWSLGKVLFLINRYIPPLIIAMDFYYNANRASNDASTLTYISCNVSFVFSNIVNILFVADTQVILGLRTYALYLKSFWLYFLGFFIVFPTLTAIFLILWVYCKYIIVDSNPKYPSQWVGCTNLQCNSPVCKRTWIYLYCYFIGFDTIIFLLTLWKYRTAYREKVSTPDAELGTVLADYESNFLKALFQDGFLFYAAMFALALGNILVTLLGPESLTALFVGPSRALRSTLCSRLFLHLRGQQKPSPVPSFSGSSMIRTMSMELINFSRKTRVRLTRPK
ncbi:uncharacterized protein BT62DRAFT_224267 [Guyanagaster necrorhizus]|uniref:DUF6533 domain-containing protein n=1 Tax=Guyanagaster necrorhizus TaxID=856835 RepID=A0A9P8AR64_9AGAR|nr:uncharacterized protein BT62DRAFT_224267 [Guyanagaster necrorhizus MCA 3950]KAG7444740.1 hypothetical protein BT62DRAFT_224267 [Guyanagaster necrorhizus MCA 3950]